MKTLLTTLVSLTIFITPIITTTNLSINKVDNNINYHHKNLQIISKPLSRIVKDNNVKVTLTLGATYGDIDKKIYNTADAFKEHLLADGYQVNYYKNDGDPDIINSAAQMAGDVYVIITTDPHVPYWKGQLK